MRHKKKTGRGGPYAPFISLAFLNHQLFSPKRCSENLNSFPLVKAQFQSDMKKFEEVVVLVRCEALSLTVEAASLLNTKPNL